MIQSFMSAFRGGSYISRNSESRFPDSLIKLVNNLASIFFISYITFFAMPKPLIPALLFLLSILAIGCDKSTDNTPDNAPAWVVVYYNDQIDKDEDTALFTDFSFDLNDDNTVNIHLPDGSTQMAKWDNQTTGGVTMVTMTMENPFAPVEGPMGQWVADEYTDTSMKLKKQSPVIGPLDNSWVNQGQELHLKKQ